MLGQRQFANERRDHAHRMDGRADVVAETRERDLLGARAAADGLLRLQDGDGEALTGEDDGGGEPVRAGSDDDGVVSHGRIRFAKPCKYKEWRPVWLRPPLFSEIQGRDLVAPVTPRVGAS